MLLKDYKPTYITNTTKTLSVKPLEDNKENIILGGAGSLAACSLFSASFGVMRIVYYLLGIESKELDTRGGGGEYLIDKETIEYVSLGDTKRLDCKVCNG